MKKINVVGTSGSGKSTFSQQLAATLGCPYLQMDELYWLPNWQEQTDDAFFQILEKALSQPSWVLDGNYNRTVPVKWANVDTVIWLDYAFTRTLFQAIKRSLTRVISGKEIWPGTGNVETFRKSFLSRDSIILWTLKTYKSNRKRYQDMMAKPEFSHIHFVRLTNPRMAAEFIQQQNAMNAI